MIVTFYSFKGGVGRSMSLANVGEILADWGYRVILCDWDLEAPGLERYMTSLEYYLASSVTDEERARAYELAQREAADYKNRPGLVDLLIEYKKTMTRTPAETRPRIRREAGEAADDFRKTFEKVGRLYLRRPSTYAFPVSAHRPRPGSLRLLTAGSRKDYERYAESVRGFRWEEFYNEWAGDSYIEFFRADLEREADLVLVDSRTGVTEHGGVATHHLADMVVLLSAANQMNIEGTQWMAGELSDQGLMESRGGRALRVFPLPSRIEQTAEKDDLVTFRAEFARDFGRYAPLLGEGSAKDFFFDVEIPYMPFYSFKERIVAREEEGKRVLNLYKSYQAVARHIVEHGLSAGLLQAKAEQANGLADSRGHSDTRGHSDRHHRPLHAPVLLSYAETERGTGAELEGGLRAEGVKVAVTPSSRPAATAADGRAGFEAEAARAAGHIFLAGREGLSPRLKAEFDAALRTHAARADFRLLMLLPSGADPKALPAYAARLQCFELPGDLGASGPALFRSLAAEIGAGGGGPVSAEDDASPFPGFEPFGEGQARFFFGRDAEVREAAALLGETPRGHVRWLQIEGPNGCGKSSLARAGLVPAVRRGLARGAPADWRVAELTLTPDLIEGLTLALHDPSLGLSQSGLRASLAGGGRLGDVVRSLTPPGHAFLLLLDNLEALFDPDARSEEIALFVGLVWSALAEPGLPFYLVTTLRQDYAPLLDSLTSGELDAQKGARRYRLGRMSDEALRQAVDCQTRLAGLALEEGLLDRVVSEVSETEEPLALLGTLMRGLWEKRTGNLLTHAAYQRLGGVRGVLLQNAEALANSLDPAQLERARGLVLEVVKSGPAGVGSRPDCGAGYSVPYDAALEAAGGDAAARAVLNRLLGPPRVLVLRGDRVGFLHESLVRHWRLLRTWVDESRHLFERREAITGRALAAADPFLRWSRSLQLSVESWERAGRPENLLLSGTVLSEAEGMLDRHAVDLTDAEREYVSLSRRRASRRRFRRAASAAAVILLVALAAAALYQWRRTTGMEVAGNALQRGRELMGRRNDLAIAELTTAVNSDPTSPEAYYERGRAYASAGQHDQARADFKEAIRLNPDYADAYREYASSLSAAGLYEEAIPLLTRYVELRPENAEAYLRRGSANASFGRRDEALRDFNRAIELRPDYAEAYNARATVYREAGDPERALADYNRAISLRRDYAEAFNNRGHVYANARPPDYEAAVADYDEALDLAPDFAAAYFNRGTARVGLKQYDGAQKDFSQAIKLDPLNHRAYYSRCELLWKFMNSPDAALADCERAAQIKPEIAEPHLVLGQIYAARPDADKEAALRNYDKALESFDRALALNPNLTDVYLYRGELYKKRDRASAVKDLASFLMLTTDAGLEARARKSLRDVNYPQPQDTIVSVRTPAENGRVLGIVETALTRLGYTVQLVTDEGGEGQAGDIRYFRADDQRSAGAVERVVEQALADEGYSFAFGSVNGLLRYGRSRRVPFGYIEVRIPLLQSPGAPSAQ